MGGKLTKRSSQPVEAGSIAPVVVYDQLHFFNVVFQGIDRMEPALFDPAVLEYTIYRTKGEQLSYALTTNLTARPGPGGKRSVPFPGFTNYLKSPLYSRYNGSWSATESDTVELAFGDCDIKIGAYPIDPTDTTLKAFCFIVHVVGAPITPEERLACPHADKHTEEGEFWGGGSGSCTVEMNTYCNDCGTRTNTYHEHRD